MALSISTHCISCTACKLVCPSQAIRTAEHQLQIIAHRCDECQSLNGHAQCASICPVENCILDVNGVALNPTGSLAPINFNFAQQKQVTEIIE